MAQTVSHSSLLHLFPLLFIILLFPHPSPAQQIGSFFTAIYLNGAPVASYQSSCSNMGQAQYCCGAGQSCAWDDTGHVACCASGANCQGSPYSSGAAAGAYSQPSSSYYQPAAPVTTQGANCNCQYSSTMATSYYVVPTSTYYPSSATTTTTTVSAQQNNQGQGQQLTTVVVQPNQQNGVPSTKGLIACATVSTLTAANVGQPVRTVGCLIVINAGSKGGQGGDLGGGGGRVLMMIQRFNSIYTHKISDGFFGAFKSQLTTTALAKAE